MHNSGNSEDKIIRLTIGITLYFVEFIIYTYLCICLKAYAYYNYFGVGNS